jgi:hypothetical protein
MDIKSLVKTEEVTQNNQMHSMALAIVESATNVERDAILDWATSLLDIRNSDLAKIEKTKQSIMITSNKQLIIPIVKMLYKMIKATIWDKRTTKSRLGIIGMTAGVTFFSGQSAGIAALGGAVGVPLWIVFGAGGTFAGYVIEEIKRKNMNPSDYIDINMMGGQ